MFLLDPEIRTNLIRIGDKGSKCLSKMSTELIKCSWSKFRPVQSSSFYIYIYIHLLGKGKTHFIMNWQGLPGLYTFQTYTLFYLRQLEQNYYLTKKCLLVTNMLYLYIGYIFRWGWPLRSFVSVVCQLRWGQSSRSGEVTDSAQARSKF